MNTVPEKTKNQAIRAIEDAEEEAADANPDETVVTDSLAEQRTSSKQPRRRRHLISMGSTFHRAWKALAVAIPAAARFLPGLFV